MTVDRKKLREMAMAALATASGEWTVSDTNEDDVQRPTRFAGPVVVYANNDCDIHPIADCSCNHTCRDGDQQRDLAAYIAAVHPGAIIELLDDAEEQEKRLRREIADEVIRLCSISDDHRERIIGHGLAMLISPTPVSDEAMEWAQSVAGDIEADRASAKTRPLREFLDDQRGAK